MSVFTSWDSKFKNLPYSVEVNVHCWGRVLLIVMPVVHGLSPVIFPALCFIQIHYLIGDIIHFDSVALYTKSLFIYHILK